MRPDADTGAAMTEHSVVIAGGGPTGLMLAAELALARVDVAIVERRESQDVAGFCLSGCFSKGPRIDRRSSTDTTYRRQERQAETTVQANGD